MSETLLNEIRATKPEAPSALRERVRALSVQEPAREPFLDRFRFNWGWRRLVLAVPATVVVALVAAGVIGLSRDGDPRRGAAAGGGGASCDELHVRALPDRRLGGAEGDASRAGCPADATGIVPPATGSSSATRRSSASGSTTSTRSRPRRSALSRSRAATAAASPRCSTTRRRTGVGTAQITLRVPTARVESAHGPALPARHDRRAALRDRGPAGSRPTRCSRRSRRRSGRSRRSSTQLESATLSDADRAVLQSRLEHARTKLTGLRESLRGTSAEAAHGDDLPDDDDRGDPGDAGRRRPPRRDQGRARLGGGRAPLRTRRRRPVRRSSASSSGSSLRLLRRRETARLLEQN